MKIIVSGATASQVVIEESLNQVVVQRPQLGTVELITAGPQGPAFTGQQFFDISSIESLSAVNSGSTLKWDGTHFVPADELGEGLAIFGGAF